MLELLLALAPAISPTEHAPLLWRAAKPNLVHANALLQKKGYKALAVLVEHHAAFLSGRLPEITLALDEALPACHTACKRRRLMCVQAIVGRLSAEQLGAALASLLGEVVLATKEPNVKSRAAAFDALLLVAERAQKLAGGDAAQAEALTTVLVSVAAGLAGKTPHMVAASLLALSRLFYEYRAAPAIVPLGMRLFETVLPLLRHREQEVVRAAVVLIKVQLSALPREEVEPLLPKLVPPLLAWCSNKHAHLKYQVRYLMERLVKRFGLDVMMAVTPEAHMRLLTHMRKQKERARRHTDARLAAKAERDGAAQDDLDGGAGGPRNRHAEYEALLGEGDDDDDDEYGDADAPVEAGAGGAASRRGGGLGLRETWTDRSEGAADVDLLTAPLVEAPPLRGAAKRRREPEAGAEEDHGVSFADGKVRVAGGEVSEEEDKAEVEVDPEDEIVREGKVAKRKATGSVRQQVAAASAAEAGEGGAGASRYSLSSRKQAKQGRTTFGANFGDAYKSKKGGKGDVTRPGAMQPHAYLPLNPRMLGRKNQRNAAETAARLVSGGRKNKAGGGGGKKR